MVNIKTLCRNKKDYERETKQDIFKINKNTNPGLHPFIKVTLEISCIVDSDPNFAGKRVPKSTRCYQA